MSKIKREQYASGEVKNNPEAVYKAIEIRNKN